MPRAHRLYTLLVAILVAALLAGACGSDGLRDGAAPLATASPAPSSTAPVATSTLAPGASATGLSGRYTLDERGMLFHYLDDATARGFYMRNTHVDLDIAFARADFVLIDIRTMEAESLDIVRPDQGFQYAVEAPAGWYAAHIIVAGDRVRFTFDLLAE
jgi:uncharacterized membrane protein (UPF0127 family)